MGRGGLTGFSGDGRSGTFEPSTQRMPKGRPKPATKNTHGSCAAAQSWTIMRRFAASMPKRRQHNIIAASKQQDGSDPECGWRKGADQARSMPVRVAWRRCAQQQVADRLSDHRTNAPANHGNLKPNPKRKNATKAARRRPSRSAVPSLRGWTRLRRESPAYPRTSPPAR